MAEWAAKVFWREVAVAPVAGGFGVMLDGRTVKTPNRVPLTLPTRGLAELVAAEWAAQRDTVKPQTMPATRMANSAIEKVAPQRDEVVAIIAEYGATDLVCYRAAAPAGLVDRQRAGWAPLVDWAAAALDAPLQVCTGVMPVPQDPTVLARFRTEIAAMSDFRIAAFHDLVALSGSLVIGFAVIHGVRDPETAWDLSRIDEDWQIAQWGADEEAAAMTALKRQDFLFAARFHALA